MLFENERRRNAIARRAYEIVAAGSAYSLRDTLRARYVSS